MLDEHIFCLGIQVPKRQIEENNGVYVCMRSGCPNTGTEIKLRPQGCATEIVCPCQPQAQSQSNKSPSC